MRTEVRTPFMRSIQAVKLFQYINQCCLERQTHGRFFNDDVLTEHKRHTNHTVNKQKD